MAAIKNLVSVNNSTTNPIIETYLINTNDVTTLTLIPSSIKTVLNVIPVPANAAAAAAGATLFITWVQTSTTDPVITFNSGAINCVYQVTVIGTV